MNPRYWIGLIGKNGAGKSTVATYLSSRHFQMVSLSSVVRTYAIEHQLSQDRESLIQTANALKMRYGMDYFARCCVDHVSKNYANYVVFDSIRHLKEMAYLKSFNVEFWGIDAPIELRYQRVQQRKHETDFIDFETFKKQEEFESSGQSVGQSLNEVFNACDFFIQNTGEKQALHECINAKLKAHASALTD